MLNERIYFYSTRGWLVKLYFELLYLLRHRLAAFYILFRYSTVDESLNLLKRLVSLPLGSLIAIDLSIQPLEA